MLANPVKYFFNSYWVDLSLFHVDELLEKGKTGDKNETLPGSEVVAKNELQWAQKCFRIWELF